MRLVSFVQMGSLVALVASVGVAVAGCGDGGGDFSGPQPVQLSATPQQVGIDTGATIDATPGNGVGVFVQYAAGGSWTIQTACDTNISGYSCGFDVFVAGVDSATTLSNAAGQDLTGRDGIELQSDGSFHFSSQTATALDGFTFDATPGAALELEMFLDGQPQPQFIYWIGDSVLHTGAPTDPIDFTPSAS
jgi:hypothetical protein